MLLFVLTTACVPSHGDSEGADSDAPACLVTAHVTVYDPVTTSTCKGAFLGSPDRMTSYDCLDDDDDGYSSHETTYDQSGCEIAWAWRSVDATYDFQLDGWASCDDHGEHLTYGYSETEILEDSTWEWEISDTYVNEYDGDGNLVHDDDAWDENGSTGMATDDWTWQGGRVATYLRLGDSSWDRVETVYNYDEAGRYVGFLQVIDYPQGFTMTYELVMTLDEQGRVATEAWVIDGDTAGEQLMTYTYVNDSDWLAGEDLGFAGVPYSSTAYTYDCP